MLQNIYIINLRKRNDRKIAMCFVLLYIMANILCQESISQYAPLVYTLLFTIVILADCFMITVFRIQMCIYIAMHVVEYFSVNYRTFPSMYILFTLYYSQQSYCLGYLPHLFTFGIPVFYVYFHVPVFVLANIWFIE